jgi:hypothetical protein
MFIPHRMLRSGVAADGRKLAALGGKGCDGRHRNAYELLEIFLPLPIAYSRARDGFPPVCIPQDQRAKKGKKEGRRGVPGDPE